MGSGFISSADATGKTATKQERAVEAPKAEPAKPALPKIPQETLSFLDYMRLSQVTAKYPDAGIGSERALSYLGLKLAGEAGEVAEKFGKIIRDKDGVGTPDDRNELIKELGDVLWYITAWANELNISLEQVARINIEKLYSRHERGVIGGSGDNR